MSIIMTKQEREAFLADVHIGIISISEEGRGPLTVPIWYAYDAGGDLRIMTGRESRKGRLLALAKRAPAPTEGADFERDLRPLARRYLGKERRATAMWRRHETCRRTPTTCLSACVRNDG